MANLKVLFIGGPGRSGSTLVERILAQLDGCAAVGEFNEIWQAGLAANRRCGCGSPFLRCAFWKPVVDASLGAIDDAGVRDILAIQKSVCRIRLIPRMAWVSLQTRRFRERYAAYCDLYGRLLTAIVRQTGAGVVIDSSKTPAHAYMLSMLDGVDLHIVQLVRDSRAVAYSWTRKKTIPDAHGEDRYMVRKNIVRSAMDWNLRHFLLSTLPRRRGKAVKSYALVRYEDFVARPQQVLSRLISPLDLRADVGALFKAPHVVSRKRATHIIEGNPSKFDEGDIEIRLDDEWRTAMRPLDHAIVSMLTAPYLRRFGYM